MSLSSYRTHKSFIATTQANQSTNQYLPYPFHLPYYSHVYHNQYSESINRPINNYHNPPPISYLPVVCPAIVVFLRAFSIFLTCEYLVSTQAYGTVPTQGTEYSITTIAASLYRTLVSHPKTATVSLYRTHPSSVLQWSSSCARS